MANYPGTDYAPTTQVNAPGRSEGGAETAGAAYINELAGEVAAVTVDLNDAIAAQTSSLVDTAAKAMAHALPVHFASVGIAPSPLAFSGIDAQRMVLNTLAYGQGSDDPWAVVVKPGADGSLTFSSSAKSILITGATATWPEMGFAGGQIITVTGSVSNDGTYLVDSVTDTLILLDAGEAVVNEIATASVGVTAEALYLTAGSGGAGRYRSPVWLSFNLSAPAKVSVEIRRNGASLLGSGPSADLAAGNHVLSWISIWTCDEGDWIDVLVDADAALSMTGGVTTLELQRVGSDVTAL